MSGVRRQTGANRGKANRAFVPRSKGRKRAIPAAGPVTVINTRTGEITELPAIPVTTRRDRPTGGRLI